jgi:membrane associated rhomboid family serine protease
VIPFRDANSTERTAVITLAVIGLNVLVWLLVQGAGSTHVLSDGSVTGLAASVCELGLIPGELTLSVRPGTGFEMGGGLFCAMDAGRQWSHLFTSMFLHGSWMHLIFNMWFLWIFGNNVEDSMGRLRFPVFYLVTGLVAAAAFVFFNPTSTMPLVGASGAISGVMGAYLVLYPRARVHTLFFFIIFFRVIPLPAWLILGYWFLIQLLSSAWTAGGGAGVAYAAHVGGFLAGVLLVPLFANRRLVRAKRDGVVLSSRELHRGGWW